MKFERYEYCVQTEETIINYIVKEILSQSLTERFVQKNKKKFRNHWSLPILKATQVVFDYFARLNKEKKSINP